MKRRDGYMVTGCLKPDDGSSFVVGASDVATDLVPDGKSASDSERHYNEDSRFSVDEYIKPFANQKAIDKLDTFQEVANEGKVPYVNDYGKINVIDPTTILIPKALASSTNELKLGVEDNKNGYYNALGEFVPFREAKGAAIPRYVKKDKTFQNKESNETLTGTMETDSNIPLVTSSSSEGTTIFGSSGQYFYDGREGVEGTRKITGASKAASQTSPSRSSSNPSQGYYTYNRGTTSSNKLCVTPGEGVYKGTEYVAITASQIGSAYSFNVSSSATATSVNGVGFTGTVPFGGGTVMCKGSKTQSTSNTSQTSFTMTVPRSTYNAILFLYVNDSDNNNDNTIKVTTTGSYSFSISGRWSLAWDQGSIGTLLPKLLCGDTFYRSGSGDVYWEFFWLAKATQVVSGNTITVTKTGGGRDVSALLVDCANSTVQSAVWKAGYGN